MSDEQPVGGRTGRGPRRADTDPHFRRTVAFAVAGTLIPGLGLIAAKRRVAGGIVLAVFVGAVIVLADWAISDPQAVAAMAVQPSMLNGLAVALAITAVAWVGVVVATHLALRGSPNRTQRVIGGALVGVLAFAALAWVAASLAMS